MSETVAFTATSERIMEGTVTKAASSAKAIENHAHTLATISAALVFIVSKCHPNVNSAESESLEG